MTISYLEEHAKLYKRLEYYHDLFLKEITFLKTIQKTECYKFFNTCFLQKPFAIAVKNHNKALKSKKEFLSILKKNNYKVYLNKQNIIIFTEKMIKNNYIIKLKVEVDSDNNTTFLIEVLTKNEFFIFEKKDNSFAINNNQVHYLPEGQPSEFFNIENEHINFIEEQFNCLCFIVNKTSLETIYTNLNYDYTGYFSIDFKSMSLDSRITKDPLFQYQSTINNFKKDIELLNASLELNFHY